MSCSCWPPGRASRPTSGATVGEIGFLRGIWMDGSRRLAWLEDYAASLVAKGTNRFPNAWRGEFASSRSRSPIRARRGSSWTTSISNYRPARSSPIVGENGAGKTTLVKLLAKLYEPNAGQILIDGVPLARMPADDWRMRLSGAFQDFFRFEFKARQTVGLGDVPRLEDEPAVQRAVLRAGADEVVSRLPAGLETQLGPTWPEGVELSFGQWQKFALARGFMRRAPLVLVLDEPTSALDAESEHALFERYAAAAREGDPSHPTAEDGSSDRGGSQFSCRTVFRP